MKIYDVSAPIYEGMPVYKNKPEKQPDIQTKTSGHVTESRISMDVHSGTHVDAPLHMVNNGSTMETIPLENLIGTCKVFDLTNVEGQIAKSDIDSLPIEEEDFILFKTKNSFDEKFHAEFVFVAEEAAKFLVDKGIRGVGIDALGIERSQPNHPTHKNLFENNVIIIEGLRLKDVEHGEYEMFAAPIKLMGTDAAPARVVLIER